MPETITTRCCIAGGGPAGMMLGFLLARAGLDVIVLEKHKDFLRDFRGDTIHPSTLEIMHELGLLSEFLKLPHERAEALAGRYGSFPVTIADFRHLPTHCQFIALMPQWDFLNFLAGHGRRHPGFRLLMEAEPECLEMTLDGKEFSGDFLVLEIMNISHVGPGLNLAPNADPSDGLLDVVIIKPISKPDLVRTYPKLFKGTHVTHPQYEHHLVKTVTVAAPGIVSYADGERFGALPLTIEAAPGALSVLA